MEQTRQQKTVVVNFKSNAIAGGLLITRHGNTSKWFWLLFLPKSPTFSKTLCQNDPHIWSCTKLP